MSPLISIPASPAEKAEGQKASEDAGHLAARHPLPGGAVLLLRVYEQQLRQKMADDLHQHRNGHHAPPVAGDLFYPQGRH